MMAENRRFDITKNKDFFNPKSNKKTHIKSKLIVVRRKIVETERPVIYWNGVNNAENEASKKSLIDWYRKFQNVRNR